MVIAEVSSIVEDDVEPVDVPGVDDEGGIERKRGTKLKSTRASGYDNMA